MSRNAPEQHRGPEATSTYEQEKGGIIQATKDKLNQFKELFQEEVAEENEENVIQEIIIRDSSGKELKEGTLKGTLTREQLESNRGWVTQLNGMIRRYPGLTKEDIYRIVKGESAWRTNALSEGSGAAGLFQFLPLAIIDLNKYIARKNLQSTFGTLTNAKILQMDATTQLKLYDTYLQMWGFRGGGLGIMQGAPNLASKPGHFVVYPVGHKSWKANPGWRSPGNGPVTVESMNAYYRQQQI